jgi:acetyl-CoA acetyltransferase
MTTSVIVAGARTPIGRLMGSLKDFSGAELGAFAIKAALEKAFPGHGAPASLVEYVIMGQVLTAGAGQMPARQAAVAAGIGWDVPALTINKMCLSGINSIAMADQLIRAGEFDVVVAGGQESMTKAPHLLMDSRAGYKYGDVTVLDHGLRRPARRIHRSADGGADRAAQRCRQVHPPAAGRVRRRIAPEGGRCVEGRRVRRRSCARVDSAA